MEPIWHLPCPSATFSSLHSNYNTVNLPTHARSQTPQDVNIHLVPRHLRAQSIVKNVRRAKDFSLQSWYQNPGSHLLANTATSFFGCLGNLSANSTTPPLMSEVTDINGSRINIRGRIVPYGTNIHIKYTTFRSKDLLQVQYWTL